MSDRPKYPECSHCSRLESTMGRLDAYKAAVSSLKDSGVAYEPADILYLAAFLQGGAISLDDD